MMTKSDMVATIVDLCAAGELLAERVALLSAAHTPPKSRDVAAAVLLLDEICEARMALTKVDA